MIKGLVSKGPPEWSVYLVRCVDGSLYTGIAKDVHGRVEKHNKGKGAAYTRARRPVKLLHREVGFTRSQALIREAEIKRFPRPKKEALIRPSSLPGKMRLPRRRRKPVVST
ncbi:MAG: GIY-YIG nuclease family protein [Elusimicrobia bacterium]|nr:GIY-YIG nuclease family protein [Elusimicrobiota bacterium]